VIPPQYAILPLLALPATFNKIIIDKTGCESTNIYRFWNGNICIIILDRTIR